MTTITEITLNYFLPEWTEAQFRAMNMAIKSHFGRKGANTKDGHVCYSTFKEWENCLGLPYTSSSCCAMYGITNTEVYFDVKKIYTYDYFAIGNDGYYYAVLKDKDENELIIKL